MESKDQTFEVLTDDELDLDQLWPKETRAEYRVLKAKKMKPYLEQVVKSEFAEEGVRPRDKD